MPPNNTAGFTLFTFIYIEPTGYICSCTLFNLPNISLTLEVSWPTVTTSLVSIPLATLLITRLTVSLPILTWLGNTAKLPAPKATEFSPTAKILVPIDIDLLFWRYWIVDDIFLLLFSQVTRILSPATIFEVFSSIISLVYVSSRPINNLAVSVLV